jgi:hypothetical protein
MPTGNSGHFETGQIHNSLHLLGYFKEATAAGEWLEQW